MALSQFDYIFGITMVFAFLDAWNIGANDVANSFASSVSSRSLKYWQAMILAGLMEFLGAVLVGNRVADTIRNKIVDIKVFKDDPAVLMLTMCCALVGSSIWLTFATKMGMPVSTTHSIVGGVIGASIAARGANNIKWGWSGVSQIIASWFIAPLLAGCFSSIIFLISKYGVLEMKDIKRSIKNALLLVPVMVLFTFSILTMLIVWKGSPNLKLDKLSSGTIAAAILGVGGVSFVLYMLFCYPVFRRKVLYNDWTLKWYDVFRGPVYWFKSIDDIPEMPVGHELTIDYYKGRRYDTPTSVPAEDEEASSLDSKVRDQPAVTVDKIETQEDESDNPRKQKKGQTTKQFWWTLLKQPKQWGYLLWLVISHGWTQDVIANQVDNADMLSGDLKGLHLKSKYYDNRVEYLYSLLQAITAATMSFAHGANDIANASGPLSTVYLVWTTNEAGSKAPVPIWILCYTAAALVIGCWTYGYNIMANLGNKFILQSPSRGFSIELGAAVTTVMATQLAIPISTTQSAVGATVFVGLCNRDLKAVNWRMVTWCYLGWFVTLPCAGLIAGLINAIILKAPRDGGDYVLSR